MDKGTEEIHAAVEDVEGASWSVSRWWEIVVEFGVEIQFVLNEASEVGAEDAGFVGGSARAVVADCWVFAKSDTHSDDL